MYVTALLPHGIMMMMMIGIAFPVGIVNVL